MKKMSKKFAKLISFVVCAVMILATMNVSVFAQTESGIVYNDDGTITIAAFNNFNTDAVYDYGGVSSLNARAYRDCECSLLFPLTETKIEVKMSTDLLTLNNIDPNGVIKVRYYSDATNEKFKILFPANELGNSSAGSYDMHEAVIYGSGWQEARIPLSSISKSVASASKRIWFDGYVNTKKVIYIDSVWFEPSTVEFEKATVSSGVRLDNITYQHSNKSSVTVPDVTTNTLDGGDESFDMVVFNSTYPTNQQVKICLAKGNIADDKYQYVDFNRYNDTETPSYKYLNVWLYSPRPQSGGIILEVNHNTNNQKTSDHSSKTKLKNDVKVISSLDWTGWKLLQFDISAYNNINTIYIIAGTSSYANAAILGYENGAFSAKNKSSFYNTWTKNGEFGIDYAYLTNSQESYDVAESEFTAAPVQTGDALLFDAVSSQALSGGQKSGANGNMYGVVLRGSAGNANGTGAENTMASTHINTSSGYILKRPVNYVNTYVYQDETGIATSETYNYLNIRMYEPEEKFDQFGNHSQYRLVIVTDNGEIPVGIAADWTGWKLISVPLSSVSAYNPADAIKAVYITTGGFADGFTDENKTQGWAMLSDASTYTLTSDVTFDSQYYTKKVTESLDFSTDNRFNVFSGDTYLYYDIERAWLSASAPATVFNASKLKASSVNPSTNRDITKKQFIFETTDRGLYISGEVSSQASNNSDNAKTFIKTNSKINVENTLLDTNFYNYFDCGETYVIALPELYDVFGNEYTGNNIWKISTEDYHVLTNASQKTITLKVSDAYLAKNPDMVCIGSFYTDENKTELAGVVFGEYSSSSKSFVIDFSDYSNSAFKQMLVWDGMNTIRPLMPVNVIN